MFPRRTGCIAFCLSLVLVITSTLGAQDKVLLRHHLKVGEEYSGVTTADQRVTQEQGGRTTRIDQSFRFEVALEVLSVAPDGTAEIKISYKRITLKLDSPMAKLDYDSADPARNPQSPVLIGFKALVGQSLTLTMDDRGKITAVKGIDKIAERLLERIPEGAEGDEARKQIRQLLSEERFSQQMSEFSIVYPEGPVGKGDKWEAEQKLDLRFAKMAVTNVYEVEDITDDSVKLKLVSTIKPGPEGAPADSSIRIEACEGTQNGTITINRARPTIMKGEIKQDITMKMRMGEHQLRQRLQSSVITSVEPAPRDNP